MPLKAKIPKDLIEVLTSLRIGREAMKLMSTNVRV